MKMEFLKMNKLRKALKPAPPDDDTEDKAKEKANADVSADVDNADDEDDDDFIMNEVKRRLKELRRNSFMVLIPEEETCAEEDEEEEEEEELMEGESSSNEWRDVEEEGRRLWSCFGAFYDKYCERMLYFDGLTTQFLKQINAGCSDSPSASKKFTSPLRCLSLKKIQLPEDDPYLDLETSYVSQLCLTWEALHCQYTQLAAAAASEAASKCYSHSAQQFQQFQVLLQRFIENEPFQPGLRPQVYAHSRNSFPNLLLQVPNISGQEMTEEESAADMMVRAPDLIRIIEASILTFQMFIKMDKNKKSRNLFGGQGQNQMATPLQQIQSSLDKRKVKLKELWKRRKGGKTKRKKNEWPATQEEVELLLGLIDVKVVGRVLRMVKITKDQLFWSEEKMKKLDVSSGKLQRDPSPILFPC